MQLVDNDTFLQRLASLFESSNQKGSSLWLTHKRYTFDGSNAPAGAVEAASDGKEYPCLIRATDGKKVKLSTHVMPGDLDRFNAAYGALLKSSMPALRKRDKKREKERAERAALRKKRMTELVTIAGAKRGTGRRKRQRLVKAALKQEESRKKFQAREQTKTQSRSS
ncbi:hypothetical protein M0805_003264 [Coniferiporia weirii]|nr:hypothetical protein M0805_003264 [Coniferiporia weirii]